MFGEAAPKDRLPPGGPEYLKVGNMFSGPLTGALILALPAEMSAEIAANILGGDPGDDRMHRLAPDALKEVLNVLCGNILSALAGWTPPVDMSLPTISPIDRTGWAEMLLDPATMGFVVDGRPVLLWIWVKE